ncbi:hypothetical protein ECC02_000083 [Trypanosoma cruzi]|uniref:Vacuolar protein sorting-associated protein 26 n=1 Tax=Trypanosoma cruzi TaxID=5693 RepID=A0A7J6YJ41_TRYCR|nr:hypothetical protein ECC02_000083 [Trypanosoma cruzi]
MQAKVQNPLTVQLDRVGGTYFAGEEVTGCVVVNYATSSSFVDINLTVLGVVAIQFPYGENASVFRRVGNIKPLKVMSLQIPLFRRGTQIPAGKTEVPFTFEIRASHPDVPLVQTYTGVHVTCNYTIVAISTGIMSSDVSEVVPIYVIVPGQGQPPPHVLKEDTGVRFELNEESLEVLCDRPTPSDRVNPNFLLEGCFDRYYNDIDIPLSGWIVVRRCSAKILSIELQMQRVEQAATPGKIVREVTELQTIQIADGNVLRNLEIPIYMIFPRWYTCPSLKTPNIRVVFDANVLVKLQGRQLLRKVVPIHLYSAS